MRLHDISDINRIKKQHNFKFSKSLGQNFLTNESVIDDIVEGSLVCENDLVIEIGPGMGVLTEAICKKAGKVIAIELDKTLIPILKKTLKEYDNIEIIQGDILKIDLNTLIKNNLNDEINKVRIIGNLPYYITTPIIMSILENNIKAESITAMMQKEVADRLMASAGKKEYGAITVAVNYYCEVEEVVQVPKEDFYPMPKVDSTVLRLDIRKEKPVELLDEDIFFKCIKAGFGQRRKTMANSLSSIKEIGKENITNIMEKINIEPRRRAETMNIYEFAKLSNEVKKYYEKEK